MRSIILAFLAFISFQALGQVQEFKLNNGLKILVKEDHRAPIAVSMIWYKVGSSDEPGGITGISHALEHMMFKGTLKYPLGVFSKTIAALGGQENAFTNTDYTAYFEKIASKDLETSFKLEADRMQNLQFNSTEFSKEMKVIQEERRLRTDDNPQALTFERYMAAAHLSAPYQHPVIGWMSDIKQLSQTDAATWYHQFYAPNNATLVVVGDVNSQQVRELAQKYFGELTPLEQKARKSQMEPPHYGKKQVEVHAPAQVPAMMLGYSVPSIKTRDDKAPYEPYALEVISGILDAGNSSRLNSQLVRDKHMASNVSVQYNLYTRYQTEFMLYATPSESASISQLRDAILAELKRLQNEPVSDNELKRIKTQVIAQKTFELDSIFSQAMELGLLETIDLGWKTADDYTNKVQSITPEQIQKTAQRYLTDNNLTEALLVPTKGNEQSGENS